MKDMTDIEKLMRDNFAEAEAPAPADAWDAIAQKVATAPNATPHKAIGKGWRGGLIGLVSCVVAGGLLWWGLSTPSDPQQHEEQAVSHVEEQVLLAEVSETSHNENAAPSIEVAAEEKCTVTETTPTALLSKTEPVPPKGTVAAGTPHEVAQSPKNEELHISPQETKENKTISEEPVTAPKSVAPPTNNPLPETPSQPLSLRIPNLITPNFDGINDCWIIDGLEQYEAVHVKIYTAQNKCVYESRQYRNDFCGEDFPDGQYFYLLTAEKADATTTRRGLLVLKR